MTTTDQIARGVKASFGARVVNVLSNAALTVILARFLLTTDQYGRLYVAISVVGIAGMIGTLGIPSSAARYVTEYAEKDAGQVPFIIRRSLRYLLVLGVTAGLLLVVGAPMISDLIGEPDLVPLLMAGALYVAFESLMKFFMSLFQAFNRVDLSALLNAASAIGRLVFASGFVLLGLGAVGAFLGYVVGFLLAAAIGAGLLHTRFYAKYPVSPSMENGLARRILEYSVPLSATRSATMIDKKVDTILVGSILGATPAAFYTIGKQVSDACIAPAGSLGYAISPTFGEEKAGRRVERAARLYERALEHMLILYIPALVGLVLVANPLVVHVFGEQYLGAVPVVQVMGVFVLANSVNKITSDGLDYLGRARERAMAKGTMAVANLVLNLLLIPTIGVVGAAIATAITFSSYTAYNVRVISRELPIDLATVSGSVLRITLISVGMGLVVGWARAYIRGIPSLLGVVLLGVAVWGVAAVAWGLIDVKRVWSFLSPS